MSQAWCDRNKTNPTISTTKYSMNDPTFVAHFHTSYRAHWTSYVVRGFSQKIKRNSSPSGIRTHTTRGMKFSSQKLYHWATKASKRIWQNLDYSIIYAFSLKIRKRKSILTDFRYRYALLQEIKNVLIICEYIFDFLKKCVPITE